MSKQYHIRWRKCQKYFYVTHWQKNSWHLYQTNSVNFFLITNTCCMISILTISNLSLPIAPVQVLHWYIFRLVTLWLVILKLSTTPLGRCSPKGLNIVSLNPYTGNITFKYLWFRRRLRYFSEWEKSVGSLIQIRIQKNSVGLWTLKDPNVAKHLSLLQIQILYWYEIQ